MKITIDKAEELLKRGQPVAFPTETVYGLGADARNPEAIRRVFEIKGRPADNPLIVHINSRTEVDDFAAEVPEAAERLMEACWPGPLTLIFRKKENVLDLITGGLDTVALRRPDHPLAQELITHSGPLVAPSANTSGRPSPTKAVHVTQDFGEDFPVLDGGSTQIGLESTVLDISGHPFRIYRPGYIDRSAIEEITGEEVVIDGNTPSKDETVRSPGTKYTHYAPDAEVCWLEQGHPEGSPDTLYLLHSSRTAVDGGPRPHRIHYRGDYHRMAAELYDRFRQADHEGLRTVGVEPFDAKTLASEPITQALRNRIQKAVSRPA